MGVNPFTGVDRGKFSVAAPAGLAANYGGRGRGSDHRFGPARKLNWHKRLDAFRRVVKEI